MADLFDDLDLLDKDEVDKHIIDPPFKAGEGVTQPIEPLTIDPFNDTDVKRADSLADAFEDEVELDEAAEAFVPAHILKNSRRDFNDADQVRLGEQKRVDPVLLEMAQFRDRLDGTAAGIPQSEQIAMYADESTESMRKNADSFIEEVESDFNFYDSVKGDSKILGLGTSGDAERAHRALPLRGEWNSLKARYREGKKKLDRATATADEKRKLRDAQQTSHLSLSDAQDRALQDIYDALHPETATSVAAQGSMSPYAKSIEWARDTNERERLLGHAQNAINHANSARAQFGWVRENRKRFAIQRALEKKGVRLSDKGYFAGRPLNVSQQEAAILADRDTDPDAADAKHGADAVANAGISETLFEALRNSREAKQALYVAISHQDEQEIQGAELALAMQRKVLAEKMAQADNEGQLGDLVTRVQSEDELAEFYKVAEMVRKGKKEDLSWYTKAWQNSISSTKESWSVSNHQMGFKSNESHVDDMQNYAGHKLIAAEHANPLDHPWSDDLFGGLIVTTEFATTMGLQLAWSAPAGISAGTAVYGTGRALEWLSKMPLVRRVPMLRAAMRRTGQYLGRGKVGRNVALWGTIGHMELGGAYIEAMSQVRTPKFPNGIDMLSAENHMQGVLDEDVWDQVRLGAYGRSAAIATIDSMTFLVGSAMWTGARKAAFKMGLPNKAGMVFAGIARVGGDAVWGSTGEVGGMFVMHQAMGMKQPFVEFKQGKDGWEIGGYTGDNMQDIVLEGLGGVVMDGYIKGALETHNYISKKRAESKTRSRAMDTNENYKRQLSEMEDEILKEEAGRASGHGTTAKPVASQVVGDVKETSYGSTGEVEGGRGRRYTWYRYKDNKQLLLGFINRFGELSNKQSMFLESFFDQIKSIAENESEGKNDFTNMMVVFTSDFNHITPGSPGAYDPLANIFYINTNGEAGGLSNYGGIENMGRTEKGAVQDLTSTIVHELGHFVERYGVDRAKLDAWFHEVDSMGPKSSLGLNQGHFIAHLAYDLEMKKRALESNEAWQAEREAFYKKMRENEAFYSEVRSEWFSFQFARIAADKAGKMNPGLKGMIERFMRMFRRPFSDMLGRKDLSVEDMNKHFAAAFKDNRVVEDKGESERTLEEEDDAPITEPPPEKEEGPEAKEDEAEDDKAGGEEETSAETKKLEDELNTLNELLNDEGAEQDPALVKRRETIEKELAKDKKTEETSPKPEKELTPEDWAELDKLLLPLPNVEAEGEEKTSEAELSLLPAEEAAKKKEAKKASSKDETDIASVAPPRGGYGRAKNENLFNRAKNGEAEAIAELEKRAAQTNKSKAKKAQGFLDRIKNKEALEQKRVTDTEARVEKSGDSVAKAMDKLGLTTEDLIGVKGKRSNGGYTVSQLKDIAGKKEGQETFDFKQAEQDQKKADEVEAQKKEADKKATRDENLKQGRETRRKKAQAKKEKVSPGQAELDLDGSEAETKEALSNSSATAQKLAKDLTPEQLSKVPKTKKGGYSVDGLRDAKPQVLGARSRKQNVKRVKAKPDLWQSQEKSHNLDIDKDGMVTVYRGGGLDVKIESGNWVAPDRETAEIYAGKGPHADQGEAKVVELKVPASSLYRRKKGAGAGKRRFIYIPDIGGAQRAVEDGKKREKVLGARRTHKGDFNQALARNVVALSEWNRNRPKHTGQRDIPYEELFDAEEQQDAEFAQGLVGFAGMDGEPIGIGVIKGDLRKVTHASVSQPAPNTSYVAWRYRNVSGQLFWWSDPSPLAKAEVEHYLKSKGLKVTSSLIMGRSLDGGQYGTNYDMAHGSSAEFIKKAYGIEIPDTRPLRERIAKPLAARKVTDLQTAARAQGVGKKGLNQKAWNAKVDKLRDIDKVKPPTQKEVETLDAEQIEALFNKAKKQRSVYDRIFSLRRADGPKSGTSVGVRIDIPAFNASVELGSPQYVITVHKGRKTKEGSVGAVMGYDNMTRLTAPKDGVIEFFVGGNVSGKKKRTFDEAISSIARGEGGKFPMATVEGSFVRNWRLPKDLSSWDQVGFDPARHSYFFQRETHKPIISAQEAIMVGNTVYVKGATYGPALGNASILYARQMEGKIDPHQRQRRALEIGDSFVLRGARIFNKNKSADAKDIAQSVSKGPITHREIKRVDEANAIRIADAFEALEHRPDDPDVKAAYQAMAYETEIQYAGMMKAGYSIEIYNGSGEPYANSAEMLDDLNKNKHMYIYSTEEGFGEEPITDKQREQDVLLQDSGHADINGKPLLYNDLFRAVHDFFGHGPRGNGFGPVGEENAWDSHSQMYSAIARRAMTTETRGQNSWVNFGPHIRRADGSVPQKGDEDYVPLYKRPFGDQKAGLLPDEIVFQDIGINQLRGARIVGGTLDAKTTALLDHGVDMSGKPVTSAYKAKHMMDEAYIIRDPTAEEVLKSMAKNSKSKDIQRLAKEILKLVRDPADKAVKVLFSDETQMMSDGTGFRAGSYDPTTDTVTVFKRALMTLKKGWGWGQAEGIMLHEILHGFTSKKIKKYFPEVYRGEKNMKERLDAIELNIRRGYHDPIKGKRHRRSKLPKAYKDLAKAYVKTAKWLMTSQGVYNPNADPSRDTVSAISGVKPGHYGLTNLDEFITETFTNGRFQEQLRAIPSESGSTWGRSIYQSVVSAIANMMGKGVSETMVDEVVRASAAIIAKQRPADKTHVLNLPRINWSGIRGARKAEGARVPEVPATKPIPKGRVRRFHSVGGRDRVAVREAILKEGIKTGQPIEGPAGVYSWATFGEAQSYGGMNSFMVVEFHVGKAEAERGGPLPRSIPVSDIVDIHEPWHDLYRYAVENNIPVEDMQRASAADKWYGVAANAMRGARKPITAQQDKAYVEAVTRGNFELADKMVKEAALTAGFREAPIWRGEAPVPEDMTKEGFIKKGIKPRYPNLIGERGGAGRGVYLTNSEDLAWHFATNYGDAGMPRAFYVKAERPATMADLNRETLKHYSPNDVTPNSLKAQGWSVAYHDMAAHTRPEGGNALMEVHEAEKRGIKGWWHVVDPEWGPIGEGNAQFILTEEEAWKKAVAINEEHLAKEAGRVQRGFSVSHLSRAEVKILREAGFDSLEGTIDFAGPAGSLSGQHEIAVFNENQVKLAETVTYDESGAVIPLSGRFTESPNILAARHHTYTTRWGNRSGEGSTQGILGILNNDGEIGGVKEGNLSDMIHGGHGDFHWRYSKHAKKVFWWQDAGKVQKDIVEAFLARKGHEVVFHEMNPQGYGVTENLVHQAWLQESHGFMAADQRPIRERIAENDRLRGARVQRPTTNLQSQRFVNKSVKDPEGNLKSKGRRREKTGVSNNSGTRFTNSLGMPIHVGTDQVDGKAYDHWIEENEAWLKPDEIKSFRRWYTDLEDQFKRTYGKEGITVMMAWLSAQQNVSPDVAMGHVFKLEDSLAGMDIQSRGGLAHDNILHVLRGTIPDKGLGRKLVDFISSGLRQPTRAWMGHDEAGGAPFVVDVHSARDSGNVDHQTLNRLMTMADGGQLFVEGMEVSYKLIKSKSVKDNNGKTIRVPNTVEFMWGDTSRMIKTDLDGAPGKGAYEGISQWGNNLTEHLNKIGWQGMTWDTASVQAVGWMRVLKQYDLPLGSFASSLASNSSRIFAPVDYARGKRLPEAYPAMHTLDAPNEKSGLNTAEKITKTVMERALPELVRMIGGSLRLQNMTIGRGVWKGKSMASVAIDVTGSNNARAMLASALAWVSEQSETLEVTFGKGGKDSRAVTFTKPNGHRLTQKQMDSLVSFLQPKVKGLSIHPMKKGSHGLIAGLTPTKAKLVVGLLQEWASTPGGVELNIDNIIAKVRKVNDEYGENETEGHIQAIERRGGSSRIWDVLTFRERWAEILDEAFQEHAPQALQGTKESRLNRAKTPAEALGKYAHPPTGPPTVLGARANPKPVNIFELDHHIDLFGHQTRILGARRTYDTKLQMRGPIDLEVGGKPVKASDNEQLIEAEIRESKFRVDPSVEGEAYHEGIASTAESHKYGIALEVKDSSFYSNPTNKVFLSEDKLAGVAVTPEGDLVSVFRHPDSAADIDAVIQEALPYSLTLDGFGMNDGFLMDLYSKYGFNPIARVPFDINEMARAWDSEVLGEPEVVLMLRNEEHAAVSMQNGKVKYADIMDQVPLMSANEAWAHSGMLVTMLRPQMLEAGTLLAARPREGSTQVRATIEENMTASQRVNLTDGLTFVEKLKEMAQIWTDPIRLKFQDKMLPVRRLIEAMEDLRNRTLDDDLQTYVKYENHHGASGAELHNWAERHERPLAEAVHKNRVDVEVLDDYLHLRHAQERNRVDRDLTETIVVHYRHHGRAVSEEFYGPDRKKQAKEFMQGYQVRYTITDAKGNVTDKTSRWFKNKAAADAYHNKVEARSNKNPRFVQKPTIHKGPMEGYRATRDIGIDSGSGYTDEVADAALRLDLGKIERLHAEGKLDDGSLERLTRMITTMKGRTDGKKGYEAVAKMVDDMNSESLTRQYKSGLISKMDWMRLRRAYKHYVPLRGWDEVSAYYDSSNSDVKALLQLKVMPISRGVNTIKHAFKASTGLQEGTQVANHLAYSLALARQGIVESQKNEVMRSFFDLIQASLKDPRLADMAGNFFTYQVVKQRPTVDSKGRRRMVTDMMWKEEANVIGMKINGKTVAVTLLADRPDGTSSVARALKNLGAEKSNGLIKYVKGYTRFMAAMRTTFSPAFTAVNFFRDLGTAYYSIKGMDSDFKKAIDRGEITTDEVNALSKKVMDDVMNFKNLRNALKGAITHSTGGRGTKVAGVLPGFNQWGEKMRADPEVQKWAEIFKDFSDHGGRINFFGFDDVQNLAKKFGVAVQDFDTTNPRRFRKFVGGMKEGMEEISGAVENLTRVITYNALVKNGISKQRAAHMALNLTTNFTRKGEWTTGLNAMYLFFNAGVQGSYKVLSVATKSKRGWWLVSGYMALGFVNGIMGRLLADDDEETGESYWDKVSPFTKTHNTVWFVPGTGGMHFKIPSPYGINTFIAAGTLAADVMFGKTRLGDAAGTWAATALESFSPVGGSSMASALTPTWAQPATDLALNRDFAGRPIYKENMPYGPKLPNSSLHYSNVTGASKWTAQALNRWTDGNMHRPGAIDISPEVLDYMANYVMGGLGSFLGRTVDTSQKLFTSGAPTPEMNDIPILQRVVGDEPIWYDTDRFYDLIDHIGIAKTRIEEVKKTGTKSEYFEVLRYEKVRAKLMTEYNTDTKKQLSSIRRQLMALEDNKSMTGDAKVAKRNQLRKVRQRLMAKFVDKAEKMGVNDYD